MCRFARRHHKHAAIALVQVLFIELENMVGSNAFERFLIGSAAHVLVSLPGIIRDFTCAPPILESGMAFLTETVADLGNQRVPQGAHDVDVAL